MKNIKDLNFKGKIFNWFRFILMIMEHKNLYVYLKNENILKDFYLTCVLDESYNIYFNFEKINEVFNKEQKNYIFRLLNNTKDYNNVTSLHHACAENNYELIVHLLTNGAISTINSITKRNNVTPLHHACYNSDINIIKLLLENGAKESINVGNNDNHTPLCWACDRVVRGNDEMSMDIVKLLLENGATSDESIDIVTFAYENKKIDLMNLLLTNGIKGDNLIASLFKNNDITTLKNIINNKIYHESLDYSLNLYHSLWYLIDNWNFSNDWIELLLQNGADKYINLKYYEKRIKKQTTILGYAIYKNYFKLAELLLKYGADIYQGDYNSLYFVFRHCNNKYTYDNDSENIVKLDFFILIMNHIKDFNYKINNHYLLFWLLIDENPNFEIIDMVIKKGAKLSIVEVIEDLNGDKLQNFLKKYL